MASRSAQKQQARERRLAEEQVRSERARRERRLRMLGGVALLVVAVVAVAIAISSGGDKAPSTNPNSSGAKAAVASVDRLLAGIPQFGHTLGSPSAKVTMTEFADLKCPFCRDLALGPENQIINNYVRTGKVKLVYRSLCTATCSGPQPGVFSTQQAAAIAAGLQGKEWYYIELFYHLQGDETTNYVNAGFLGGLAKLVPGLNYSTWLSDSQLASLKAQVSADQHAAGAKHFTGTPSVIFSGPKGEQDITSVLDYSGYQSAINSVS